MMPGLQTLSGLFLLDSESARLGIQIRSLSRKETQLDRKARS